MSKTYTAKILSSKEFERVARSNSRYANVLDSDDPSIAFADPKEGNVYIRNTDWPALNRELLHHELDHLVEERGTHEDEFGVRHKKVFKSLAPILGGVLGSIALPGIGTALGWGGAGGLGLLGGSALAGLGAAGGTTLGNLASGQTRALGKSALISGGLGAASSGIGSLLKGGGTLGAQAARPGATAAAVGSQTEGPASGISSVFKRFNPLIGNQASNPILGGTAASRSPITPWLGGAGTTGSSYPPFGGGGGGGGGTGQFDILKGLSSATGLDTKGLGSLAVGGGISALGNVLGGTPKFPGIGSLESVKALQSGIGRPISDIGKLASQRLTERLGAGYQGLPPEVEAGVRRQFEQERNNIISQFKAFRPGADLATDSEFRRYMEDLDQRQSESLANLQVQERQRFAQNQAQDITSGLGLDESSKQQLAQIAQLDIATIMGQYGVDAQTARDFKAIFSNLGGLVAQKGLGLNNFVLQPAG